MRTFWYDKKAQTIFSVWEDEIDVSHFQSAKRHYLDFLQTMRAGYQKDNSWITGSNKIGVFEWVSREVRIEANIERVSIDSISRDLWCPTDAALQIVSALFTLALLEEVEVEQARHSYSQLLTASWHNSIDYNGNVAWLRSWIKKWNNDPEGEWLDDILVLLEWYMKLAWAQDATEAVAFLGKKYWVTYTMRWSDIEGHPNLAQ
jgi:hypothetical protein